MLEQTHNAHRGYPESAGQETQRRWRRVGELSVWWRCDESQSRARVTGGRVGAYRCALPGSSPHDCAAATPISNAQAQHVAAANYRLHWLCTILGLTLRRIPTPTSSPTLLAWEALTPPISIPRRCHITAAFQSIAWHYSQYGPPLSHPPPLSTHLGHLLSRSWRPTTTSARSAHIELRVRRGRL